MPFRHFFSGGRFVNLLKVRFKLASMDVQEDSLRGNRFSDLQIRLF